MKYCIHTSRLIFLLVGLVITGAGSLVTAATEPSVRPGINDYYQQSDIDSWIGRFERPGREVYDRRYEIVTASDIRPGMVVADIGASTGLFTFLFAPRVGDQGMVIAVDISRAFIEHIRKRAEEKNYRNIRTLINTPTNTRLRPNSIDLAFVSNTYHHFEYPQSMLASIHRALRTNGSLIIIDFRKRPGTSSAWVMRHVRAGKTVVIREIEASGFRLVADKPILKTNYFLVFKPLPGGKPRNN